MIPHTVAQVKRWMGVAFECVKRLIQYVKRAIIIDEMLLKGVSEQNYWNDRMKIFIMYREWCGVVLLLLGLAACRSTRPTPVFVAVKKPVASQYQPISPLPIAQSPVQVPPTQATSISPLPTPTSPPISLPPTSTSTRRPTRVPSNTPTPTPTWAVVVPATATPSLTSIVVYSTADITSTPTIQLSSDRREAMIRALEPLPAFAPLKRGGKPPDRIEVLTQKVIALDVNGDDQDEILWVFLLQPIYNESYVPPMANAVLEMALFDEESNLLWRSELEGFSAAHLLTEALEVDVRAVSLAVGELGLFFNRMLLHQGSGAHREQLTTLYRWCGTFFDPIWQRTTAEGGRQGAGYGSFMWEQVALQKISNSETVTALLQHSEALQDSFHRQNYALDFPGAFAYEWGGEAFTQTPTRFVNEAQITPIRPRLPLYFAPRVSEPITIDGREDDWFQIEYRSSLSLNPNEGAPRPNFMVAWDDEWLYFIAKAKTVQKFFIAFDVDLSSDFVQNTLSDDDIVWDMTVTVPMACTAVAEPHLPRPLESYQKPYRFRALLSDNHCVSELAIPLDMLGLADESLAPEIGWVTGETDPYQQRQYHPRAGKVIGFATNVGGDDSYHPDDPSTWTTLIFMADR